MQFYDAGPRNGIKLFMFVIYEFSYKAEVFVPRKLLQPSLFEVSKVRAFPSEASFKCCTLVYATLATDFSHKL